MSYAPRISLPKNSPRQYPSESSLVINGSTSLFHLSAFELVERSDAKENDLDSLTYVMRAMEFLQKNYSERLSAESLADTANMSKSTFLRHFKRYFDATPLEYLNRYRVKEAQRLLEETDMSVTTIAQECGFFDSSHFIKSFKKQSGVSPAAFRQQKKILADKTEN